MAAPANMSVAAKAPIGLACAALLAAALSACAKTVSTGAFQGEQHEVAQAISNLQSDVTAGEERKVFSNDLASEVVAGLDAAAGRCRGAIEVQVRELHRSG